VFDFARSAFVEAISAVRVIEQTFLSEVIYII